MVRVRRISGKKIREARNALGLTGAELAERCEIKPPMITYLENNTKTVNAETLSRIADVLGVTMDSLMVAVEE